MTYIVSGRVDENSDWVEISAGDLPWRYGDQPARNSRGLDISSTYQSGDVNLSYTEVTFDENAAAFLHYKVQFPESRSGGVSIQFSEVELPGVVLPEGTLSPTTPPPTSAPVVPTPPPTISVSFQDKIFYLTICRTPFSLRSF